MGSVIMPGGVDVVIGDVGQGRQRMSDMDSVHWPRPATQGSARWSSAERYGGEGAVKADVYWRGHAATLYLGDAREVLHCLPAESVECVVTSPPYWGLRDYRVHGQYGLESTVDDYVDSLVGVLDEISRVLVSSGTVWLNLADTFGGSWGNYIAADSTAATAITRAGWPHGSRRPPQTRCRPKDLQGVPWRVALASVRRGWWLREAIVWVKPNARPEGVRDRLAQRYEMVFALARGPDHWWAPEIDEATGTSRVWSIPAPRSHSGHVAAGPVALAARCLRIGCPPGGRVLDPFSGSGTTALAAHLAGSPCIGIDLDPAAHEIARGRLATLSTEEPTT